MEKYIKYFRFSVFNSTKAFHIPTGPLYTKPRRFVKRAQNKGYRENCGVSFEVAKVHNFKRFTSGLSSWLNKLSTPTERYHTMLQGLRVGTITKAVKHQRRSLFAAPFTSWIALLLHTHLICRLLLSSGLITHLIYRSSHFNKKKYSRWTLKFLNCFFFLLFSLSFRSQEILFLLFMKQFLSHKIISLADPRSLRRGKSTLAIRRTQSGLFLSTARLVLFHLGWWMLSEDETGSEYYTKKKNSHNELINSKKCLAIVTRALQ